MTAPLGLPNEHYGPLLAQHVKTILECGLLLDEDYEVLLNACNFRMYPSETTRAPCGLICTSLATVGSVFVAWRYRQPIIILPSAVLLFVFYYAERMKVEKRDKRQKIVSCIINSFVKVRKLNTAILKYIKTRNLKRGNESLLLYNDNVNEFVTFYVAQSSKFFEHCLEQMNHLSAIAQELSDDYKSVKQLDIAAVLMNDSHNKELQVAKLQDICTFLTSKYLNYLGLTFCNFSGKFSSSELKILLDNKLTYTNVSLEQLYDSVQKKFNNLRYCAAKKLEIVEKSKNSFTRHVSGKLQQTLLDTCNNLSIIMEKSRTVMEKTIELEDGENMKELEVTIGDLRDHAFATYQSLDVLCQLYGIYNDANIVRTDNSKLGTTQRKETHSDDIITKMSYDDKSEVIEESYELFIPQVEQCVDNQAEDAHRSESSAYLSLMLKELRQSLEQHERFVAARTKLGIDKNKEEVDNHLTKVPKFDLNILDVKIDKEQIKQQPPVAPPRPSKLLEPSKSSPPPPPPPPQPVNAPVYLSYSDLSAAKSTLFDGIKTLSSQLQSSEETFGDDTCDSEK